MNAMKMLKLNFFSAALFMVYLTLSCQKVHNKQIATGFGFQGVNQKDPRELGNGDIFESYPRFGSMKNHIGGFKKAGEYNSKYYGKSGFSKALPLIKISQGNNFSVHNYFHVCPESPDGKWIVYCSFPNGPFPETAGPCDVVICDRKGKNHKIIGSAINASQHNGARAMWIDNKHIIYTSEGKVHKVNIETGKTESFTGMIDNYSSITNKVLFPSKEGNKAGLEGGAWSLDIESGELEHLIDFDDLQPFSPLDGIEITPESSRFAHTYWSPDASKIAFAIFNGSPLEAYIFLADPDGSNIKYWGPKAMHWTFFDNNSFFGHDDKRDKKDKYMRRWDFEGNIIETIAGVGCHGTISPNGEWIVTESWYGSDPTEIYLYKRGETTPTKIIATQEANWKFRSHVHPAFSRDGKRVYFNFNAPESKGSQLYAADLSDYIKNKPKN